VDAKDDEVTLLDNKKIYLGTGNDLEIYHDGSNSRINDAGTGNLKLQVGGSDKLEVTSTGISVTGDISATGTIPASVCTNNLIINGNMAVDQRNSGSAYTGAASYILDRWKLHHSGTDEHPTAQQHALTKAGDALPWADGLRYSLLVTNGNQTSIGAGDYMGLIQHVEAYNARNSGWDYNSTSSYITLSFWIKSSVAQNFYGYIRTPDGTSRAYIFETGSLTADTWTKITKTIPGDSNITINNDNGAGLSFYIYPYWGTNYTGSVSLNQWGNYASATRTPDYGTDNDDWWDTDDATLELTGVQIELGQVANDFKHELYAETLSKCQRYYQRWGGGGTGGDYGINGGYAYDNGNKTATGLNLSTPLRTEPTVENMAAGGHIYSQGTNSAISSVLSVAYTENSNWVALALANTSDLGNADYAAALTNNTNQHIGLDAEL
tara:strand:- start:278 stop:1588 length:1311 start_codon:yes stop_codon:yes gene_type:complete